METSYSLVKYASKASSLRILGLYLFRGKALIGVTPLAAQATGYKYNQWCDGIEVVGGENDYIPVVVQALIEALYFPTFYGDKNPLKLEWHMMDREEFISRSKIIRFPRMH